MLAMQKVTKVPLMKAPLGPAGGLPRIVLSKRALSFAARYLATLPVFWIMATLPVW